VDAALSYRKEVHEDDLADASTHCSSSVAAEDSDHEAEIKVTLSPAWLGLLKPGSHRVVDFFLGLMQSDVSEAQADRFVKKVLDWGSAYPKVAQRLRQNRNIVKSEVMRKRLASVMEGCKARSAEEVSEHLLKHYQHPLSKDDVKFVKTLGTGSVAQVVLFKINGQEKVMKMTWLEDKAKFEHEFDLFEWWLSAGDTLKMMLGTQVEQFLFFLKVVLSKKQEILNEFDLTQEAEATVEGSALLEQCWQELRLAVTHATDEGDCQVLSKHIRVPAVHSHSARLLEQERAGGESLEELAKTQNNACYVASQVYCEILVPLLGYMLMQRGMTHADAHLGNLRYDASSKTFWVIDWGAVVRLDEHRREALRRLVVELDLMESFDLSQSGSLE
jgi:predicted unusual protein kinase regulating ubiquinone biosynthesis (AarF/ABC1/UbiB family)